MNEREQLLERIRKLVDRAKRDAGAEARSARNLARVLMERHGITAADLELTDAPHVHFETTRHAGVEGGPTRPAKKSRPIPVRVKVGKGIEIRFEL